MAATTQPTPFQRFKTKDLLLDPENPRIVELGLGDHPKQFDILKALWERMAVNEVAMSIAWNGYFDHEPLFIEVDEDGRHVVIEGNRRLTAVKLLLDADLRRRVGATDLPDIDAIDPGRRAELAELPGRITTRIDSWRYLGFKHVNGPATWGAYAKAQYVSKVHNEWKVPLEEIARQIGDFNNTVERQYHGLMVIEQAERAEVFRRDNVMRRNGFEFSHIYEGLSREGIQKFLGLTRDSRSRKNPVPASKIVHLGELLQWIYGDRARNIEPRMRTQAMDLGDLSAVLLSKEGIKALRNGLSLALAKNASLGDPQLLRQALARGKQALQDAMGLVATGFDGAELDAYNLAESIELISTDLLDAMRTKRRKKKRSQGANADA